MKNILSIIVVSLLFCSCMDYDGDYENIVIYATKRPECVLTDTVRISGEGVGKITSVEVKHYVNSSVYALHINNIEYSGFGEFGTITSGHSTIQSKYPIEVKEIISNKIVK